MIMKRKSFRGGAMSYNYVFTAIRGRQAKRDYFVAMCPLKLIPKIFLFDEDELRPEIRAQRVLNKARVPEIAHYLANNPSEYVFSSLTASMDGEVKFEPFSEAGGAGGDAGRLIVPMTVRFLLNDGQHRRAGIEEALKLNPSLGDETISVVFFLDTGLKRSQQMFADLNKHAVRPTFSLGVLYDHRNPVSKLAVDLAARVTFFRDMVEKEKTSISNRSTKLFTLSGIYHALAVLIGKRKSDAITNKDIETAVTFWETVGATIPEWEMAKQRKVASADLRETSVHAHGVALQAIALVGAQLLSKYPDTWQKKLSALRKVDWSRSNSKVWEGRALINGRVSKSQTSVRRTANYLKQIVGLTLTEDDLKYERGEMIRSHAIKRKDQKTAKKIRSYVEANV
jgi:DNA sulfur modification protein DndB